MLAWLTLGFWTASVVGGGSVHLRHAHKIVGDRPDAPLAGENVAFHALYAYLVPAAAGLFVWLFYLSTDLSILAWSSAGILTLAWGVSTAATRRQSWLRAVPERDLWVLYAAVTLPTILLTAVVASTT